MKLPARTIRTIDSPLNCVDKENLCEMRISHSHITPVNAKENISLMRWMVRIWESVAALH